MTDTTIANSTKSTAAAAATPATATMLWLHALTPVHVGAGRGAGVIDLPIVREAVTHLPYLPSSEIKGVLAASSFASADFRESTLPLNDADKTRQQQLARYAFGTRHEAAEGGGALVFCDARLVCFPARSLYGTFTWLACGLTLQRLKQDLEVFLEATGIPAVPNVTGDNIMLAATSSVLALPDQKTAFVEDLDFAVTLATPDTDFCKWADFISANWFVDDPAWEASFKSRFALISDEAFGFLTDTACEVRARVRLKEQSKTVIAGQLWYEEYLPQEALLAAPVWCDGISATTAGEIAKLLDNATEDRPAQVRANLLAHYCKDQSLRLGGKQSVGKGQCQARFAQPQVRLEAPKV